MQKHAYIVIHDVVSRVISFVRNIIGLDSWWKNISLVKKFSLKIGMGMDNTATCLTIE